MADASNCSKMIQAYLKGFDLHAITAADFLDMTLEQFMKLPEDQISAGRDRAKAGNFGLIYKISPAGFQAFAASSYNVKMTIQEAEKYHAKFFETYPEIRTYHEKQINIARKQLYVRNQLGHVRHLPLINSYNGELRAQSERQAVNAPTQGCLFQMMMLLMSTISRVRPDIWMFGNTHDSLEMYLKEDTWMEDAQQIKQLAEHLPLHEFDWTPKVPFTVDFEMSKTNMAELKKVKIV
jgi:DNA polymerase-1